jgi:Bacterial Ig-like domain
MRSPLSVNRLSIEEEHTMTPRLFLLALILASSIVACKETIVEYRTPKEYTNDLLHGDIIGRVTQKTSGAVVLVSQVAPIDSVLINPQDGSFAFRDLRAGNYDITIRSERYRIYLRNNVTVPRGGISYIGEIDLSTVPDLVETHYPEHNGEVVYDWRYGRIAVSILFTHPMDRMSVEQSFSTIPPSDGVFIWGNYTKAPLRTIYATDATRGEFEPGATITTFSKITSLTYSMSRKDSHVDTSYTVILSTGAHDTSGNSLRFPLRFSFRTVQSYVTIYGIQTSPMHGDIDVDPFNNGGVTVTFPRRMDPVSTEAATFVTPPMNRVFLWPEGNVLRIYPGGPFLTDTTITVRIDGTARDRDGVMLGETFSFWFRTAPLRLSYTVPNNAQLFVSLSQQIIMRFNSYVILSSVQPAFSISPRVEGIFSFSGNYPYENPNEVVFTPSGAYQANTKYTVTVAAGVRDMYGVSMKVPNSFSFVTRPY